MSDKHLNICVIDDDALNRFTTEHLIKKCISDVNISLFDGGGQALSYLKTLDKQDFPDIILLDLYMPEMDGWQFLDAYQSQGLETTLCTIYILSSSVDERDIALAEGNGLVQEFLKKPIGKDRLATLLSYHQETR